MAQLTREDVLKLANLSRLELSEEEVVSLQAELNQILDYVDQLKTVDTDSLEPTNQVTGLVNVAREDKVIDYGYPPSDLLKNVPEVHQNQIQVKRMVE
jgi:aspartyl-tRNA(Asn)/glutamyl-tRNA(Gln) amidotransferase subunit C